MQTFTSPPAPPAVLPPAPPAPPAAPSQLWPAVPPAVVTGALTPVLAKPAIPPAAVFVPLFVAVMAAWQGFANAAGAAYDITPRTKAKPIVTEIAFFIVQKSTITLLIND